MTETAARRKAVADKEKEVATQPMPELANPIAYERYLFAQVLPALVSRGIAPDEAVLKAQEYAIAGVRAYFQ